MGEDGKVGLSMKHVNQGNGTDLDPNGVELQRDLQRRKTPGTTQRKAIQLEAVLNTTCTKCGTRGHLSKDCFMSPDGKKYELIPEVEEESISKPDNAESENTEKKVEKKHKSKKKKRKSKRNKQSTEDSDTEDKERSKKKKFSKERKKHRKKYSGSSSDSSDSSSSNSHDVKAHKRKHSEDHETRTKKCKHSKTKHSD